MTNKKNIVTSEDVTAVKKPAVKKVIKEEIPEPIVNFDNNVIIYFESGAGYITNTGFKFSRENPIGEVSGDQANLLLRLSNFRLASDEEKELYYNNQEG